MVRTWLTFAYPAYYNLSPCFVSMYADSNKLCRNMDMQSNLPT